jgi:hypothetical protein
MYTWTYFSLPASVVTHEFHKSKQKGYEQCSTTRPTWKQRRQHTFKTVEYIKLSFMNLSNIWCVFSLKLRYRSIFSSLDNWWRKKFSVAERFLFSNKYKQQTVFKILLIFNKHTSWPRHVSHLPNTMLLCFLILCVKSKYVNWRTLCFLVDLINVGQEVSFAWRQNMPHATLIWHLEIIKSPKPKKNISGHKISQSRGRLSYGTMADSTGHRSLSTGNRKVFPTTR